MLNLSLGLDDVTTSAGDPLSAAVERAWAAGIVVVVAVGNDGQGSFGVDSPAVSPYVIAVGATEVKSSDPKKDEIASFSNSGDGVRNPDFLAPGNSIISLRVPGSMLDVLHPEAVEDGIYFRGSGTSQATAATSGWVAALLSKDPTLTPDQVKYLLTEKSHNIASGNSLDGAGRVRPGKSAKDTKKAGDAPIQNHPFAIIDSNGSLATGGSWSGGSWSGGSWSGGSWSGAGWSGVEWSGGSWSGAGWSGVEWSGGSWSGGGWSGGSWSGGGWSGGSWSGSSWSGGGAFAND